VETGTAIALREELIQALQAHADWKQFLYDSARRRETDLPVAHIKCHDCCRFGAWMNALPPFLRISRDAREVNRLHEEFHACAGTIAEMIVRGEFPQAHAALNGEDYNRLSVELERAVSRWHMAAA
jgi:hypothetical protein